MRPVERGDAPNAYTDYRDARFDLRARQGDYCSYCERQIETNLAVEHIQPKDPVPALRNEWSNFLLGCVNCNSSKGATPVAVPDYLWPDLDNTLRAIDYAPGGLVNSKNSLAPAVRAKADSLIQLVGLDKDPGNPVLGRRPTDSDDRWLRRQQAWQLAEWCLEQVANNDTAQVRALVVEVARGRGLFSIFWTVFAGDIDLRRRLREAFVGTAFVCFDPSEECKPRPGGQV
jgi:uncharacterized protein (TIGR02646 family)